MPLQPVTPAETAPTDAEQAFVELSPPGMWPENQGSNFGQIRKVLTDIVQECIDKIDQLGEEMFVATAVDYLGLWEEIVHVPVAPTGLTEAERRSIIAPRLQYGPFTRKRRREIVESFIIVTFGESASFTSAGIPLTAGGISLLSGVFSLVGTYVITEDIPDFSYEIQLLSSISVDVAALTKELERVTPAGISFTITTLADTDDTYDEGVYDTPGNYD